MHKYNKNNLKNANELRKNPTAPEKILWEELRKSKLGCKFRRQQPIGAYIADFVCFYPKIVIELDGGQHNENIALQKDFVRDEFLKKEGFRVIRIWNSDIYKNLEGVVEYIKQEITALSPTPKSEISTLPSREGSSSLPQSENREICQSDFSMEGSCNSRKQEKNMFKKSSNDNQLIYSSSASIEGSRSGEIIIQCPAKINLDLKVTSKRPDGFHNITSIMQTISLYDFLSLKAEPAEKFEINLSGTSDEIPYNEKNLVYKAILLFIEKLNLSPHRIDVYIEKNIPVSAGLAGGSTNAAGILKGLNVLLNNPLSDKVLHELCAKLGSDLNFCLKGGRQLTTGRGEILEELPFEEFEVSLIKPLNLGISAKEAYTKFSKKLSEGKSGRENFKNDLEWAVIDDYKELQKIKNLYPDSMMSGSGSSYFLINGEFGAMEGYVVKNGLKAVPDGVKVI